MPLKPSYTKEEVTYRIRAIEDEDGVSNWWEYEIAMQMIDPMLEEAFQDGQGIKITIKTEDGKITVQLTTDL